MPSKSTKKARRASGQPSAKKVEEERGWIVVLKGTTRTAYVFSAEGVTESEAHRLSDGLAADTEVVQVTSAA